MKNLLVKLSALALAVISMTAVSSAAGFSKSKKYPNGKFTDVPEKQWYAAEVKSAYELGLMNGQSDTTFGPDGNVTVAEGVTMASRVHAIYNGKTIAEKNGGKWYDMYIDYAKANGLITDGQFTNFDRNIMRYEMAVMFAKAMPASYFTAKNEIKDIPDVAETEEYYDELMMLYKAGVVLGSDDYGNFYATNPIKRSETAAIINRLALPENRKEGKLLEYGDREQAVYLINDHSMTRTVRKIKMLASGWSYEDMGNQAINGSNATYDSLSDNSDKSRVAIHRDITVQNNGIVRVESLFSVASNNGACFIFSDINGDTLFELRMVDGKLVAFGENEQKTDFDLAATSNSKTAYFEFDLDNRKAKVVFDGEDVGTFDVSKKAKNLARMTYATTDKDKLIFSIQGTHMYVNYDVNDSFRYSIVGEKPYGWDVDGNVVTDLINSDWDANSVKISGKGSASKNFEAVGGKFIYETFLLPTKSADGYVVLDDGNSEVFRVDIKSGEFLLGDKKLRSYDERCWHLLRVEADTDNNKAIVKINNKVCLEVPFVADKVDSISIVNNNSDLLWFDDVQLYNVYDYTDYCPTPVPVTDDEWLVGMSVCSLWREGTHYGWDCISPYDDITPVLGYYDEGLPEVSDWEIKFLVEHGFDFQHFCWYASSRTEAIKQSYLGDAIVDGYMNAKYSDMMDMMIMWENNGYNSTSLKSRFYDVIWPYWCEWYFSDERYFTIDNKPVITIYRYDQYISTFGGYDGAAEAFEFMNNDIKRYGFDGIILLSCGTYENLSQLAFDDLRKAGFSASVNYSFGELAFDPVVQINRMMSSHNANGISLVPCIGVGFNDLGWTETRTPLITPVNMYNLGMWAKQIYMPMIAEREEDDWISHFVFYTTWNEFGEGHYIFPSSLNKFGYVDANRAVFSSVAGKNDNKHFDVEPTDNQKARLGYLYPARHVPLRRTMFIDNTADIQNNIPVKTWDFENSDDCKYWVSLMNTTMVKYDPVEKALVAATTTRDGAISPTNSESNYIDADKARYLHISIKYDKGTTPKFDLFFVHSSDESWSAEKGVSSSGVVYGDGEYHEYIIDMKKNNFWTGIIKDLRFDPMSYEGNFYIKKFEFLSEQSVGSLVIDVDSQERVIESEFVFTENDEIYIAGNPSEGFYSLLNIYTEYNRIDGTLDLYSENGTINLVVGSDVVTVNGKEVKLSRKIERVDGLVTVPLKLVCDTFGYKYTYSDNLFKIVVREIDYNEILKNRVPNEFEFNIPGDMEGWTLNAATGGASGGCVSFNATRATSASTGFDPTLSIKTVRFNTKYYNKIQVRYRATFEEQALAQTSASNVSIYFATDSETGLDEKKSFKVKTTDMQMDAEGFYNFTVDCNSNEKWIGTVNQLRFDPANLGGYYEVDFIRIVPDEKAAELMVAEQEREKLRVEKLYAVDNGEPFFIENPDAEDLTNTANLYSKATPGNSVVEIVEDDLRPGNHVYKITPNPEKQAWAYFRAKTRFKPGVTYTVEYEMRVICNQFGEEIVNATSRANPRYSDEINGVFKNIADHAVDVSPSSFSTSDGWLKVTTTFTIKDGAEIRDADEFSLFVNPQGASQEFKNISFMVDNFVVKVQ